MYRFRDKWRVTWRECGKKCSRLFENPNDARLFEAQIKSGIADVRPFEVQMMVFSDFAEKWFREYAMIEKSESTWEHDLAAIRNHLNPIIGELKLDVIRKVHGIELKSEISRKGLKPKSVNNILQLAKKILGTAVDFEFLKANPFQNVKPLKATKPGFRFWTISERDKFLERGSPLRPEFCELVKIAVHTGLRMGELRALKRSDLDFDNGIIRVGATYNRRLKKVLNRSKNGEIDFVPMNSEVLSILATRKLMKPDQTIFRSTVFENARRDLRLLCVKANVPVLSFHSLRHTFASCLAMAGVNLMVIQKLMRHKSYEMTLRYAHLHPNSIKGVTDVLVTQNKSVGAQMAHNEQQTRQLSFG